MYAIYVYTIISHEDNPMRPSSSSQRLCACWALCVSWTNFCFNWCIYAPCLVLVEHSVGSNTNNAWTPQLASMSLQSHCGDEEDGSIGLSSWLHYICIMLLALCLLSTLCHGIIKWSWHRSFQFFPFERKLNIMQLTIGIKLKKHKNQSTSFLNCF